MSGTEHPSAAIAAPVPGCAERATAPTAAKPGSPRPLITGRSRHTCSRNAVRMKPVGAEAFSESVDEARERGRVTSVHCSRRLRFGGSRANGRARAKRFRGGSVYFGGDV